MAIPIDIPESLTRAVGYKDEGVAWLKRLPELLEACARRWELSVNVPMVEDYAVMSYNYITPAMRKDGSDVIIKIVSSKKDFLTERDSLQFYGGKGAVKLLDSDEELDTLLLERLIPGVPLSENCDDEENTRIAASVMRRLWHKALEKHGFRYVADEAQFDDLRTRFNGNTGPLPAKFVAKAEAQFAELIATSAESVVLHSDLHHWNILSAEREPWLAIDSKGLVGDPAFEVASYMHNLPPKSCQGKDLRKLFAHRATIFAEELGFTRERILAWSWTHCLLCAWWGVEVDDDNWQGSIELAELIESVRS